MDSRFLELYEGELKHVRAMGGEFARAFPKIAGRLGLDEFDCADPYVERMIEAFAFLTARVHMRFDSSFAEFTAHLLELLYPGHLAPTPSMAVVQLRPNSREGALKEGVTVPRGASLRSRLGGNQTACEYRTAHAVTLWPIEVVSADYTSSPREFIDVEHVDIPDAKAALRIVVQAKDGADFSQLPLESLPVFLRGEPALTSRLLEHMLRTSVGMVMQQDKHQPHPPVVSERCVKALGFDDDQALLPCAPGGFHGHRLLHEYFAFPERFSFVELQRLQPALKRIDGARVEIILLFREREPRLEGVVNEGHLALFCTPAINLFARSADRIHLDERDHEHHIVVDRTRPRDFEVHSVTDVKGHGASGTTREFL
ncbi:MAG TPA: type VI secretion system baseplate subunit TssF, partial [Polyangiales bacterium]|nr:type VI secretion system baseplate subunit TssF [Polyangiales bacterium]